MEAGKNNQDWRTTLRAFRQFVTHNLPPEEREFCQRWMLRGDHHLARIGMAIGLPFYAIVLAILPAIARESNRAELFYVFMGLFLAHLAWTLGLRKTHLSPRISLAVISNALMISITTLQNRGVFLHPSFNTDEITTSVTTTVSFALYLLLLCPYYSLRVVLPTAILYSGLLIWGLQPLSFSAKWIPLIAITMGAATILQVAKNFYRWQEARREWQAMQRISQAERQQMAQSISAAEMKAKESQTRYEAITRTTRMLAHDVRKPFSMVRALSKTLQNIKDPAAARKMMDAFEKEIEKAVDSVDDMINDILCVGDTPDIQAGPQRLESIIEVALTNTFRDLPRRDIQFSYDWSHKHLLEVDGTKIVRAVSNIIENATRVLGERGAIWFQSRELIVDGKTFLEFCIGNNGEPMDTKLAEHVFDAYVSSPTQKRLGLGLAIARRFIEAHGGSIRVSSLPELGTRFWIALPAHHEISGAYLEMPPNANAITDQWFAFNRNHEAIEEEINDRAQLEDHLITSYTGRGIQLLIVDDEPLYADAVIAQVQPLIDAEILLVHRATTGEEALAVAESNALNLILCDIDLGANVDDGFVLVRKLRNAGCNAYIAMHSNRISKHDAKEAIAIGANTHLPKPVGRTQLARLMAASRQESSLYEAG